MIHGVLPVYKPVSMSSFDVIRIFKRHVDLTQKVGHAGTLDVFASGVVLLLLGDMTNEFVGFQDMDKEYLASIRLGYFSNTLDIEGTLVEQLGITSPKLTDIKDRCQEFTGTFSQAVPFFSAAKHEGKRLYKLAQEGKLITKFKEVTVSDIYIEQYKYPLITLRVTCGSGTYIRQLSYDIFQKMGIESFVWQLERTRIGDIGIEDCAMIEDIKMDNWEEFLFEIE